MSTKKGLLNKGYKGFHSSNYQKCLQLAATPEGNTVKKKLRWTND
jgi:hypothetical protein